MPSRRGAGRFSRPTGRPLRPMDWENARTLSTQGGGVIISNYVLAPSEVRSRYTDPTLMATRVWGSMRNQSAPAANQFVGVGLIAWSDANDTIPTDPPGPLSNGDMDWIVRYVGSFYAGAGVTMVQPVVFDLAHSVKAKRRLGNDHGLLVVIENAMSSSVDTMFDWRFLIKE